jgi:hypothetical protein
MTTTKFNLSPNTPFYFEKKRNNSRRYFWGLFKKKSKSNMKQRPGAMSAEAVRNAIQEIGIGNQVEITRIGFDGEIDDKPMIIEIINFNDEEFTGKIINVERHIIESATEKLVYAKQGGGVITFRYDDGDIKDISISRDLEILKQERNVEGLREILAALENGDRILVAYYDTREKGSLNAEGVILEKNQTGNEFKMKIEKINRIELENKIEKSFNVSEDIVIDIEMV